MEFQVHGIDSQGDNPSTYALLPGDKVYLERGWEGLVEGRGWYIPRGTVVSLLSDPSLILSQEMSFFLPAEPEHRAQVHPGAAGSQEGTAVS